MAPRIVTEEALLDSIGEYVPEDTPVQEAEIVEELFDADQMAEAARIDLNVLAGLAIPDVFRYLFPPMLLAAWQILTTKEQEIRSFPKIALGIPRGHAKTTLIKLFVLYCILFTQRKFILVIANTEDLAVNILSDIVDMLNQPNIRAIFGNWKDGIETDRQDLKKFGFRGRNIILAGIGAEGSIRGMNLKNVRPDVMVFEDIQTKEDSESAIISSKILQWMIATAMKAQSPYGCVFIFIANMYPTPHSILRKLKDNPNWIKFISGAILEDGTAIWEELRPIKDLIEEFNNDIAMGHPEIFFSEVLNDITSGVNSRIDFSSLPKWKWPADDTPQGKMIIIDPATDKLHGDAVAIGYFEIFDGLPGFRKVVEEKLSPGETIKKAIIMALETGTRVIACESSGYQYSLLYWFGEVTKKFNLTNFQFVPVYPGNSSKNSRITQALKSMQSGEIIIHEDVKPALARQTADWNPLRRNNRDNILDLLTYPHKVIELYGALLDTREELMLSQEGSVGVSIEDHAF